MQAELFSPTRAEFIPPPPAAPTSTKITFEIQCVCTPPSLVLPPWCVAARRGAAVCAPQHLLSSRHFHICRVKTASSVIFKGGRTSSHQLLIDAGSKRIREIRVWRFSLFLLPPTGQWSLLQQRPASKNLISDQYGGELVWKGLILAVAWTRGYQRQQPRDPWWWSADVHLPKHLVCKSWIVPEMLKFSQS